MSELVTHRPAVENLSIQSQTVATLADCSAAAPLAPSASARAQVRDQSFACWESSRACLQWGDPPASCLAYYALLVFRLIYADYLISSTLGEGKIRRAICFKPFHSSVRAESGDESSSSSSSSESSCASQVG